MDFLYQWMTTWSLLFVGIRVTPSNPPSGDDDANWEPRYLQQISILQMTKDPLTWFNICAWLGFIPTYSAFFKTAIHTSLVTYTKFICIHHYGHNTRSYISSTGWTWQHQYTSSGCVDYKDLHSRTTKMTSRGAVLVGPDTTANKLLWPGFKCHTKVNEHTSGLKM